MPRRNRPFVPRRRRRLSAIARYRDALDRERRREERNTAHRRHANATRRIKGVS